MSSPGIWRDADAVAEWLADYATWCAKWERFLREFTLKDGRKQYAHGPS